MQSVRHDALLPTTPAPLLITPPSRRNLQQEGDPRDKLLLGFAQIQEKGRYCNARMLALPPPSLLLQEPECREVDTETMGRGRGGAGAGRACSSVSSTKAELSRAQAAFCSSLCFLRSPQDIAHRWCITQLC